VSDPAKATAKKTPTKYLCPGRGCKTPMVKHPKVWVRSGTTDTKTDQRVWRCPKCGCVRVFREALEWMLLQSAGTKRPKKKFLARIPTSIDAVIRARATEEGKSFNDILLLSLQAGLTTKVKS
jgi:RNase P subunit RPR2